MGRHITRRRRPLTPTTMFDSLRIGCLAEVIITFARRLRAAATSIRMKRIEFVFDAVSWRIVEGGQSGISGSTLKPQQRVEVKLPEIATGPSGAITQPKERPHGPSQNTTTFPETKPRCIRGQPGSKSGRQNNIRSHIRAAFNNSEKTKEESTNTRRQSKSRTLRHWAAKNITVV